ITQGNSKLGTHKILAHCPNSLCNRLFAHGNVYDVSFKPDAYFIESKCTLYNHKINWSSNKPGDLLVRP
ncbi:hypothetical protein WA026_003132, partial [Henosepilachna vigintioctopunctata]